MVFGFVEIHFRSINDVVIVYYAEMQLNYFKKRKIPFSTDIYGNRTMFEIPETPRKMTYEKVLNILLKEDIQFQEGADEPVTPETTGTIRVGDDVKFYFSGDGKYRTLELISLSRLI